MRRRSFQLSAILLFSLIVLALSTLAVFAIVSTRSFNQERIETSTINTKKSVHQSKLMLGNQMAQIKLSTNRVINTLLNQQDEQSVKDSLEKVIEIQSGIKAITIADEKDQIRFYAPAYLPLKPDVQAVKPNWIKEYPRQTNTFFSTPHIQDYFIGHYPWVITYTTSIKLEATPYLVSIDYDMRDLATYFRQATIGEKGYTLILDDIGNIIYHPQQQLINAKLKTADLSFLANQKAGTNRLDGEKIIFSSETISEPQWQVVGILFLDDVFNKAQLKNTWFTLIVLLIVSSLVMIISVLISNFIAKPIYQVSETMKRAKNNQFKEYAKQGQFVEVASLSVSYNSLIDEINELMATITQEQQELRKSELKALQAQINPHFLYNTLDSILWMCERGNNQGAATMVNALGKLMRLSLNKGSEEVTLREELTHVENYLIIQKIRYRERFSFKIKAAPDLLDYPCLRLIIQPFIENAIYHGLSEMVDEGFIEIELVEQTNAIWIKISDNGLGMSPELVTAINQGTGHPTLGIGIENVHRRLQIYFGEAYGILVSSELDEGTCVIIRLPKSQPKESDNEK